MIPLLLLLLAAATALGQTPPTAGDGGDGVSLQFANAPVTDILREYEALTGKTLVRDANLAGPQLTLVTNQKLSKEEAVRFIESALLLNGYSLIPGPDNTVKVLNTTTGKLPRNEGALLYTSLADLPKGDQVVSFYMPLRYANATDVAPIFQQQVAGHPYGVVIPVPGAQAVVVTDNSAVIRQLIALKELIDVPPAKVMSEFVQLHRADAEKVGEILTKLLDIKPGGGAPGAAPAPAGAGGQFENKLVAGQVQIVPDPRTNRILVVTRPVNFAYLKGLIEQFDQSADVMEPYSRPLKYIKANDVLPVLQSLLAESKEDITASPTSGTTNPNANNANRNNNNNNNNNSSSQNSGLNQASPLQSQLESQPDEPPQALVVGKTRLIADNKTNAILVFGPPENIARVRVILDKLDIRAKQVYLAAVIGKLSLTNDSELSVDVLQQYANFSGKNGVATSAQNSGATGFPDPRSLTGAAAFPIAGGLSLYGAVGHTLSYYVHALESTGRFSVLSRPSVFTANNKSASISSGQQVPVSQGTLSSLDTTSNTSVSQQSTIGYKDIELLLEVLPLINSEKEVTLDISTQNNNVSGSTTISGNSYPTITTDKLETTVTVPNKQTIVLGGLIRDSDTTDRTGVPLLKDIPVLGALFRGDTKNRSRDELVILIEPTVIETDADLVEARQAETERSKIGADSVKYATKPTSTVTGKSTALESLTH